MGPVLIKRFGVPIVYALGCIAYVLGLVSSGLASSLHIWIITHGVVTAVGMAFLFMAGLQLIYTRTPKEFRGLCVGLSFSGGGCGGALIPPLLTMSVKTRGLSSTMLVMAL